MLSNAAWTLLVVYLSIGALVSLASGVWNISKTEGVVLTVGWLPFLIWNAAKTKTGD